MTLSEELIFRGFNAETTIKDIKTLDTESRTFYLGCDPSADSLTIGNLASLMMVACFAKHGHRPILLIGGATGQIGDPKENGERDLKTNEEIEYNKSRILNQYKTVAGCEVEIVDNNDWFKNINYIEFLREIGKQFSMTQLLDRQFVQSRIGEGGSGISYAEFSYTLIQGYDFLHLFREKNVTLQLCGADQFGNSISGMHLIKRIEGKEVDVYSTPLVIDKASGKKFGKSEGNAVWLAEDRTSVFDYYQFWLGLPDDGIDYYIKIYTFLGKEELEDVMKKHQENPEERIAQKILAYEATRIIHGKEKADAVVKITTLLFGDGKIGELSEQELELLAKQIPTINLNGNAISAIDALADTKVASSKTEARNLIAGNAISINNEKIQEDKILNETSLIKKGKNKFILIRK